MEKKHADELEAQGFTIDRHCSPPVAYKGPRFAPTEIWQCYSDFESQLLREREANQRTISKPLSFGELTLKDKFIGFPLDGDDAGHGGYRGESYVFEKVGYEHAVRLKDGAICGNPAGMRVLKVIV
jgi:hypothetical protein